MVPSCDSPSPHKKRLEKASGCILSVNCTETVHAVGVPKLETYCSRSWHARSAVTVGLGEGSVVPANVLSLEDIVQLFSQVVAGAYEVNPVASVVIDRSRH